MIYLTLLTDAWLGYCEVRVCLVISNLDFVFTKQVYKSKVNNNLYVVNYNKVELTLCCKQNKIKCTIALERQAV